MEFQATVTELNSLMGKPVHVSSTIGGQVIGGDGVLKNVLIPRPGNRENAGQKIKVEFQDGRMFAIDHETVEINKVSKDVAKEGESKSLNVAEGDEEETDEAKEERELRADGKTVGARKRAKVSVDDESEAVDEAEDESEDEEAVEETPKVKKKAKGSARVKKSR
jgi:hypothetical protein